MTRFTSASTPHLSLRLSRYSIAARSLAVMMPSLSEALAFHMRTLPSSEPDITKRASAEYIEADTLTRRVQSRHKDERDVLPLHSLRMINFRRMTLPFLPYPQSPIPSTADKLCSRRTPVARHDCRYMGLVYLGWGCEMSDVERVQIMIFRSEENGCGEGGGPGEGV